MSSDTDSEEDFLSADEGSDYDIPRNYGVAANAEVCPSNSVSGELKTIDQSTAEQAKKIETCTEHAKVKVLLFDEDTVEPPLCGNVSSSRATHVEDSQQNDTAPPLLTDKIIERTSSKQEAPLLNKSSDSSKSEESSPKKSSLVFQSVEKCNEFSNATDASDTQPNFALERDEAEVLQGTLVESSDIILNEFEDLKLSSCSNVPEDTEISKSNVASVTDTSGLEFQESAPLHLTENESISSIDQHLAIRKFDLHSIEKLESKEDVSEEHSITGNVHHLHSNTINMSDGSLIENLSNLRSDENEPTIQSFESIHDVHTPANILDLNTKPDPFLTKPRKTSKIGLKKPREKLGERIGVKKLGSKVNQPLESISCDSLKSQSVIEEKKEQVIQHCTSVSNESRKDVHDDTSNRYNKVQDESSWGSAWGNWGTSLLSAASTLTQEVGRGVGSVVELVEEGIGVPSPEELAKEQRERERILELEVPDAWQENWSTSDGESTSNEKPLASVSRGTTESSVTSVDSASVTSDNVCTSDTGSSASGPAPSGGAFSGLGLGGFSSLVSGVSGALETAGSKVVFGGLDTLELIGRRTMDVLQDSDPNLRSRKDRLMQRVNKPNLAAVLREAREKAVANPVPGSDGDTPTSPTGGMSRVTFAGLWDNSTGPAHLEALALIARQCSTNSRTLQATLPPARRREADRAAREIMELSEIDEESLTEGSIFSERVAATIRELGLPLNADNIAQCWSDLSSISEQYSEGSSSLSVDALDGRTVQSNVVGSCVLLVERLVAVAHKAAELCLTTPHDEIEPTHLATQYRELVVLGGSQLESCADAVCTGLSSTPQQEKLTPTITNIYMQVCEGSSCLQQSLVHLCTTLQLVQLQRIADPLT